MILFFIVGVGLAFFFNKKNSVIATDTPYIIESEKIIAPRLLAPENVPSESKIDINSSLPSENTEATKNLEDGTSFIAAQKAKTERLRDLLTNDKDFDLNKAMEKNFDIEEYNEGWASKRKDALENIFENIIVQQGSAIKSINCRSKHCRVELFYQTQSDINKVSDELLKIISESHDGLFVSTLNLGFSKDNKEASIYLTDDLTASLY